MEKSVCLKAIRIMFVVLFSAMVLVPLLFTNLQDEVVSIDENRYLARKASLFRQDGSWNPSFTKDFEAWINDNIGFRSHMVLSNARIQYRLFHVLANNTDYYLGPAGELNYATEAMLRDYQHLNFFPDNYLQEFTKAMRRLEERITETGSTFLFYQCWDKHSVYPESFPETVIQYGNVSRTDLLVEALKNDTGITVISPKERLIREKENHVTYGVYSDVTHWTQRGAYIGYLELMEALNRATGEQYRILREEDYEITLTDQGPDLFGGIHLEDYLESFTIRNPSAKLTNEKLTLYNEDKRHCFYTNDVVDNDTRVLIIGDSYFGSFIVDDIAESFHETIIIWGDYLEDIGSIVEEYNADIVIMEEGERVDRTGLILAGVKQWDEQINEK